MNLQDFGVRLLEVRDELGLTQDEMAVRLGVSKRSYCAYEGGETSPNAKILAALAECGIDVAYVLTGHRFQAANARPTHLSPRQAALLDNYDHLTESDKSALERHAFALAEQGKVGKKGRAA